MLITHSNICLVIPALPGIFRRRILSSIAKDTFVQSDSLAKDD